MGLDLFLTAYDPLDLPGLSVDPLGFERGYLYLADKVLPGMTNVAACPRYFGLLCAGAMLTQTTADEPPRDQRRRREETICRLERLWALANVLATRDKGEESPSGLRGVRYATRQADLLAQRGLTSTDTDFKLLIRQVPYGVIGIYGAVAEVNHLIYRSTMEVTPGLGDSMGESFLVEAKLPAQVKRAVVDEGQVSLQVLANWGERAFLWGEAYDGEARCLADMIEADPVRWRFASVLPQCSARDDESELERLRRVATRLAGDAQSRDLWEATEAILLYEACYRWALLGFTRLIFLCRHRADPTGGVVDDTIQNDDVLAKVKEALPRAVSACTAHLDAVQTPHLTDHPARLKDVRSFLQQASAGCRSVHGLVDVLLARHADVQHGKFDQGRRKLPWMQKQGGRLALTFARVGELNREPDELDAIAAHPYRLSAADNWLRSARLT